MADTTPTPPTAHTPGPWLVLTDADGYYGSPVVCTDWADVQERHQHITTVSGGNLSVLIVSLAQAVAAPSLLDALRSIVGTLRGEMWGDHIKGGKLTMDVSEDDINAALAAIAQAEAPAAEG